MLYVNNVHYILPCWSADLVTMFVNQTQVQSKVRYHLLWRVTYFYRIHFSNDKKMFQYGNMCYWYIKTISLTTPTLASYHQMVSDYRIRKLDIINWPLHFSYSFIMASLSLIMLMFCFILLIDRSGC